MAGVLLAVLLPITPFAIKAGKYLLGRGWRRRGASVDLAQYAPTAEPIAPLPRGWERWKGARPEPRGAPTNTILAVRGIEKMTPTFRAKLLDLCEERGIPVDSLAAIISSESGGFNPKALNPLPAAGLIQLTVGANLEGFRTKEAIRSILEMSAEEQIERVIRPYYLKMGGARGAHPGHLYMLNFLPGDASKGEDFKLGEKDAKGFRGAVYRENKGFDREQKGYITIGDVYVVAARVAGGAKGRRITVDGRILEPSPGTTPAPAPAGSSPPKALPPAPSPSPAAAAAPAGSALPGPWTFSDRDPAGGLLLRAFEQGRIVPPSWVQVQFGDLTVEVTSDALRAPLTVRAGKEERFHAAVRLPVTYREQIAIARGLGAVSFTMELWDATWRAASIKLEPKPLPADRLMASVGRAVMHSANIDAYGAREGVLIRDVGKGWILHPRLGERGAVNYGWISFKAKTPKAIQSPGARHNDAHTDYSQTCVLVRRKGRDKQGRTVDLLEYMESKGLSRRWLDAYR